MIIHEDKLIFVHVPKSGGTSIEKFFLDRHKVYCNWDKFYPLFSLSKKDKEKYMLQPGTHKVFGTFPEEYKNDYFSFGLTRNPWDKMVSCYKYFKKDLLGISFKNYIFCSASDFIELPNNKNFFKKVHFQHQYKFLKGCNFIGRYENLQEDFNIVCDKIGIPRQELPHENATKHTHYSEYYDDETREIVAEIYAKDIEYFGYEFGE